MCIAIDVGIQASDVEDFLKIRPKIKFNNWIHLNNVFSGSLSEIIWYYGRGKDDNFHNNTKKSTNIW